MVYPYRRMHAVIFNDIKNAHNPFEQVTKQKNDTFVRRKIHNYAQKQNFEDRCQNVNFYLQVVFFC